MMLFLNAPVKWKMEHLKRINMLTITNEDNMALMARYPDKYFDLAIVDPPYGINADIKNNGKNSDRYEKNIIGKN